MSTSTLLAAIALRDQGHTLREIGARVGLSHEGVRKILNAAGVGSGRRPG